MTHIPFIYYIGKENWMMAYDEYNKQHLSKMVDRVRNDTGDPRYYLAELKVRKG